MPRQIIMSQVEPIQLDDIPRENDTAKNNHVMDKSIEPKSTLMSILTNTTLVSPESVLGQIPNDDNHIEKNDSQMSKLEGLLNPFIDQLFAHREFDYGPCLPIIKRNSDLVIEQDNIFDPHSHRRTNNNLTEIKIGDSLLECPSLIAPLLLRKKTRWPSIQPGSKYSIQSSNMIVNGTTFSKQYDGDQAKKKQTAEISTSSVEIVDLVSDDESVSSPKNAGAQTFMPKSEQNNRLSSKEFVRLSTLSSFKCPYGPTTTILTVKDPYQTSAAQLLYDIGSKRVEEWALNSELKSLKRKPETDIETSSQIERKISRITYLKEENKPFNIKAKYQCSRCYFKTEFKFVLEDHMKYPHRNKKRDYLCNWCDVKTKDSKRILYHCLIEHRKQCQFEPQNLNWCCIFCPIESRSKKKMELHIQRCSLNFQNKLILNTHDYFNGQFDFPCVTSKPIEEIDVRNYEETLISIRPQKTIKVNKLKLKKPQFSQPLPDIDIVESSCNVQDASTSRDIRINLPNIIRNGHQVNDNRKLPNSTLQHIQPRLQPSVSNNYSNPTNEYQSVINKTNDASQVKGKSSAYVICEICDAYLKDLSQLKYHMQWIHTVKLNQKTLQSKPPLFCQKCKWRFFTDEGLERHLLGAHKLVTTNMQEQVEKGCDSGRCTICGKAFFKQFVLHMKEVHEANLKPAHLSYKCTICSASFNLYKLFENHVYSIHSNKKA